MVSLYYVLTIYRILHSVFIVTFVAAKCNLDATCFFPLASRGFFKNFVTFLIWLFGLISLTRARWQVKTKKAVPKRVTNLRCRF